MRQIKVKTAKTLCILSSLPCKQAQARRVVAWQLFVDENKFRVTRLVCLSQDWKKEATFLSLFFSWKTWITSTKLNLITIRTSYGKLKQSSQPLNVSVLFRNSSAGWKFALFSVCMIVQSLLPLIAALNLDNSVKSSFKTFLPLRVCILTCSLSKEKFHKAIWSSGMRVDAIR